MTRAAFIAPDHYPDELTTSEGYAGGARKQILVKKGMPAALRLPLPGMRFSFADVYGEPGSGFIHVRHIKPL